MQCFPLSKFTDHWVKEDASLSVDAEKNKNKRKNKRRKKEKEKEKETVCTNRVILLILLKQCAQSNSKQWPEEN